MFYSNLCMWNVRQIFYQRKNRVVTSKLLSLFFLLILRKINNSYLFNSNHLNVISTNNSAPLSFLFQKKREFHCHLFATGPTRTASHFPPGSASIQSVAPTLRLKSPTCTGSVRAKAPATMPTSWAHASSSAIALNPAAKNNNTAFSSSSNRANGTW